MTTPGSAPCAAAPLLDLSDNTLATVTLALLGQRAPTASICPSEVARHIAPDAWRDLMPRVRTVAAALVAKGQLRITQGDREIDPAAVVRDEVRGPLRLRRPLDGTSGCLIRCG
jgi:hypothetical protein